MPDIQSLVLYVSLFTTLFFEVFILITYLEAREEIKTEEELIKKGIKHHPTVTVIVPCFNEERTVAATLRSILHLDYPKDKLKVVAVNDGSTDGTLRTLSKFKNHPQVEILSKENGGKHTALNLAIEKVDSDLVGCLDADSFVNSDALKRIVPFFNDSSTMAVAPSIKVHEPKNVLQYLQKVEYSWGVFLRRMLSSIGALYVTPGPFSIFRTNVFRELGGYKAGHNTEDCEIAMRMQKNHYKIVNSQGAHVYTVTPAKLKVLVKQRVRWTYGFLNNAFDYREMFFNRKYGHIGMFVLPIATSSIFSTLYIIGNTIWRALSSVWDFLVRIQTVGFSGQFDLFSFDWFFINTSFLPVITISALLLTLLILYLSLKFANGKDWLTRGIIYYIFLYAFLSPLWVLKALFDTVFRRQVSWR